MTDIHRQDTVIAFIDKRLKEIINEDVFYMKYRKDINFFKEIKVEHKKLKSEIEKQKNMLDSILSAHKDIIKTLKIFFKET